jgi:hypothetical protein
VIAVIAAIGTLSPCPLFLLVPNVGFGLLMSLILSRKFSCFFFAFPITGSPDHRVTRF